MVGAGRESVVMIVDMNQTYFEGLMDDMWGMIPADDRIYLSRSLLEEWKTALLVLRRWIDERPSGASNVMLFKPAVVWATREVGVCLSMDRYGTYDDLFDTLRWLERIDPPFIVPALVQKSLTPVCKAPDELELIGSATVSRGSEDMYYHTVTDAKLLA